MSKQVVQTNTSQTNSQALQLNHYPIITETENSTLIITDLKKKGCIPVSFTIAIIEALNERLKRMDINANINIMDYFFDKFFNKINKKVIIITDHLKEEFESYEFKQLIEDRLKELKDEILKEVPSHIGSRLYYSNDSEAILVHYYLNSSNYDIEKILKEIPASLMMLPESYIRKKEYIYKGQYNYIIFKRRRNSENENYEFIDIFNWLRGACYYTKDDDEYRVLELKNIIITEVTPYAAVLFIKELDRAVFGDYSFNNGTE